MVVADSRAVKDLIRRVRVRVIPKAEGKKLTSAARLARHEMKTREERKYAQSFDFCRYFHHGIPGGKESAPPNVLHLI